MKRAAMLLIFGSVVLLSCSIVGKTKQWDFPLEYYIPAWSTGRANEFGAALDYAQCRMRETALDSVQSVFLNELLDYADRKFPVGNNAIQPGRILESPEHLQRMAARGVPCVEIQSASAISLDFRLIRVEAPMGKVVFSCDWSYVCARFAAGEGDMDGESPHNRGRRCRQRGG